MGDVDGDSYSGEIKYQHLVSKILCNLPREECWLNSCKQCEDTSVLEKKLISIFAKLDVDEVTYKQWQSTDRTELVTITESTADFVQSLIAKIQVLKVHMFIHDMQTKHFYDVKENLSPGEVRYKTLPKVFTGQTLLAHCTRGFVTTRRRRTLSSRH